MNQAKAKPVKRIRPNRVMLTLSPEAVEVIALMGQLTKKPRTRVLTEFVEMAVPQLKTACRALERAREGQDPQKVIEQFKHSILQELGD